QACQLAERGRAWRRADRRSRESEFCRHTPHDRRDAIGRSNARRGAQIVEVREPGELAAAYTTLKRANATGVIVLAHPMFIGQRRSIADLALTTRIPAIYHLRDFVRAGGLISYGAEYEEMFRQSAVMIDKILKGAKPSELPVEQPWRYDLAINLKTAKALGLTI